MTGPKVAQRIQVPSGP